MDKVKKAGEVKTVEYKIDSIEVNSHKENDYAEYGLKSTDLRKWSCEIGLNIQIVAPKSKITIPIKIAIFSERGDKRYELFTTEASFSYKIKRFKTLFTTSKEGRVRIPDGFILSLLGTTIGGMRGIIVASAKTPEYKKVVLPFLNLAKMLQEIKKKNELLDPATAPLDSVQ
jgi:hypothetical protein